MEIIKAFENLSNDGRYVELLKSSSFHLQQQV